MGCDQVGNLAIGCNLIEVCSARNGCQVMPMPGESLASDSLLCTVDMGGCGLLPECARDVHDNGTGLWKDHTLNRSGHVAYDMLRCMRLTGRAGTKLQGDDRGDIACTAGQSRVAEEKLFPRNLQCSVQPFLIEFGLQHRTNGLLNPAR
ncbi:hypothetical protein D9M68_594870 [compost metagenome]